MTGIRGRYVIGDDKVLIEVCLTESQYDLHKNNGTWFRVSAKTCSEIQDGKSGRGGAISERYQVCGLSCIHNREALCLDLGIEPDQGKSLTDDRLFSLCYDRWQTQCPDRILGEWVFVLWDCREKELFIATSHYWQSSLFYYRDSDALYFATSLGALLEFPEVPKVLNEFFLGRLLVGWGDPMGETLYKDIR